MFRRTLSSVAIGIVLCMSTSAFAVDIIPFGSNFRYLNPLGLDEDPGDRFDTTWFGENFNDSDWGGPSPAPFARVNEEGNNRIEAFTETDSDFIRPLGTGLEVPPSRNRLTSYFRTEFTLDEPVSDLAMEYLFDDGARVYLNGEEILSVRCCLTESQGESVPPGEPTSYEYLATGPGNEKAYELSPILLGEGLSAGTHTLAVEVHQSSWSSNDMAMSMRMFDGYFYEPVINTTDSWSMFEGEEEPAGDPLAWTQVGYDEQGWQQDQQAGFGYDFNEGTIENFELLLGTEVDRMQGDAEIEGSGYSSLYIRKQFAAEDLEKFNQLQLQIDYDDGFVAYINGEEVARSGTVDEEDFPIGQAIPFDSFSGSHDSSDDLSCSECEIFEIPLSGVTLNAGDNNVLAIHGLNTSIDSSDFLLGQLQLALVAGIVDNQGDFDGNGELDLADINALLGEVVAGTNNPEFDVTGDGLVDQADITFWAEDLKNTYLGDANLDGEFSSADFVTTFTAGKYENGEAATWDQGDWNGDGTFGSSDFVTAFSGGGYEVGPRGAVAAVPEPSSCILLLLGMLGIVRSRR